MEFDKERKGTGTAEWAEVNENICRGCQNNCLYCYAAYNANRFGQRDRANWSREELTQRAEIQAYPAKNGVIMFPSSHDITPFNLDAYIRVAKLILEKGNKLLIVSKPRLFCVEKIVEELEPYLKQILFRFTMGTVQESVSLLWEPGAPLPRERRECLALAYGRGFNTSVSIEPMLEGSQMTEILVEWVREFVSETIWIGRMNKPQLRVPKSHAYLVDGILKLQNDDQIMDLYEWFKDDGMIRWKDSIKTVVEMQKSNIVPHYEVKPGQPCSHPGCANHITHPCEGCGRIAAMGARLPACRNSSGEGRWW